MRNFSNGSNVNVYFQAWIRTAILTCRRRSSNVRRVFMLGCSKIHCISYISVPGSCLCLCVPQCFSQHDPRDVFSTAIAASHSIQICVFVAWFQLHKYRTYRTIYFKQVVWIPRTLLERAKLCYAGRFAAEAFKYIFSLPKNVINDFIIC